VEGQIRAVKDIGQDECKGNIKSVLMTAKSLTVDQCNTSNSTDNSTTEVDVSRKHAMAQQKASARSIRRLRSTADILLLKSPNETATTISSNDKDTTGSGNRLAGLSKSMSESEKRRKSALRERLKVHTALNEKLNESNHGLQRLAQLTRSLFWHPTTRPHQTNAVPRSPVFSSEPTQTSDHSDQVTYRTFLCSIAFNDFVSQSDSSKY
jgi:hypothetical protein